MNKEQESKVKVYSYARWQFKRNILAASIPAIVQFLLITLPSFPQTLTGGADLDTHSLRNLSAFLFALGLMSTLVIVHRHFAFMHNKQQADFVFSLPHSRRSLFFSLSLNLALLILYTRLLSLLQLCLVNPVGLRSLASILRVESNIYLHLLAAAAFLIFFYCEAANAMNAQFLALLVNIAWPALFLILQYLASSMLPGYVSRFWLDSYLPCALAPYLAGFLNLHLTWSRLGFLVGFILLFLFLAYRGFQLRQVEKLSAQDLKSKVFVLPRLLISLSAGLGFTMIVMSIRAGLGIDFQTDLALCFISLALACLICTLIQDLLYSRGNVRVASSLRSSLLAFLPALAILLVMIFGNFSWDSSRPSKDNASYVYLSDQNIRHDDIFSFNRVLYSSSSDTLQFKIENPERLACLEKILEQQYELGREALLLPRSLNSTEQFLKANRENLTAGDRLYSYVLSWSGEHLGIQRARSIYLALVRDSEARELLCEDPAFRVLLLNDTANDGENYWVRRVKGENSQLAGNVQKFLQEYGPYPLIRVLFLDYQNLSEQERLRLDDEAQAFLEVQIVLQTMDNSDYTFELSMPICEEQQPYLRKLLAERLHSLR